MADQILMFRSGFKRKKTPGSSSAPLVNGTLADGTLSDGMRADGPHTEDRAETTIKLIARGRERKLRFSRILSRTLTLFKYLLGIRTSDVLGRPKNRIQFMLWLAVLAITGVSAAAMVLGTLGAPPPVVETVDTEGFEETVDMQGAPQTLTPPESIAIAPALDPAALGAEPAVGIVERLDAGPSLTQMSGDAPGNLTPNRFGSNAVVQGHVVQGHVVPGSVAPNRVAPNRAPPGSDVRGAWLEGTIQDEVVDNAPFGR